jgi:hypothetical protein
MRIRALFFVLALTFPARADAPKPEPMPATGGEAAAVQAYGAHDPGCAQWSDGCVTCRRAETGIACSTPGIACIPGPNVCRSKISK